MTRYSHLLTLGVLLLPLTIVPAKEPSTVVHMYLKNNYLQVEPVDGSDEPPSQPQQQTTTIDSKIVAIAVDYHAALLLACSDLIHRKDVPAVERCAKSYLSRIIQSDKSRGKE